MGCINMTSDYIIILSYHQLYFVREVSKKNEQKKK